MNTIRSLIVICVVSSMALSARTEDAALAPPLPTPKSGEAQKVASADTDTPKTSTSTSKQTATATATKTAIAKPANVLLTSGKRLDKVWAIEKETGAWIVVEGTRYWYRKADIAKIEYLKEEPTEEMKASLKKSEEAQKKEEENLKQSDLDRLKEVQEKAADAQKETAALKGAAENRRPSASSGGSTTSSSSVSDKGDKKNPKNDGKGPHRRRRYSDTAVLGGVGSGSGAVAQDSASGGSGGGGSTTASDSVSGGGGGGTIVEGRRGIHLAFQWRVKWINRKKNLIRIKNRYLQKGTTLLAKDPKDLKHVHKGDILRGQLTVDSPNLVAEDGTVVDFAINEEQPLVLP